MSFVAISKSPVRQNNEGRKTRQPVPMPETAGEIKPYVTTLKKDCPKVSLVLLGINFDKMVFQTEASLIQNQGKQYESGYLARNFSKNQVEALKNRAKEIPVFDAERKQHGTAADWIILEEVSKFNPTTLPQIINAVEPIEQETVEKNIKDELYDQQGKRRK